MSSRLASRAEAAKRANLAGLLFCFLSILSVCLTIFNLYLFYWIWTSLNASGTNSSSSVSSSSSGSSSQAARDQDSALPVQLNLFDQLELLRDDNKIAFQDKLLAKKTIQVNKIKQINEGATLKLSSAYGVQLKIDDAASRADLVVSAKRNSLEFPEGFIVRRDEQSVPSLECRPGQKSGKPFCHLHAKQLELSRPEGVDFRALKSIQTGHLRTRRLHSALNKLQLMTGSGGMISFESHNDRIHVRALDLVSLGSRNSTVIIKAKTIKLGELVEKSSSAELDDDELSRGHKLCVCLEQQQQQREEEEEEGGQRKRAQEETNKRPGDKEATTEHTNNGLVFAIQNHLRCSQFTETKCAR